MSRANELAAWCDVMAKPPHSPSKRPKFEAVAAELRRLDRVNAELELFAARWQQLEHMYSRGATADTLGHYIGRPERLDYAAKLRREHDAALTSSTGEPK